MNGCGRAWPIYGTCFNYGERGHYALECPHLRERGGMYLIFGRGRDQGEGVNPLQHARVPPLAVDVVAREGDERSCCKYFY